VPALKTLKATVTRRGLANLLRFKLPAFAYILFQQRTAPRYRIFQIPKRNGGTRTITAPDRALKLLQRRLSDLLQDCAAEINDTKKRKDKIAHGFKRARSIVSNARQHRNRRYVFNVDLEDFFPSINFGRVRGYFMRDASFGLHRDTATLIAQIACHQNALPQGSPCSPVISNLIAHVLDIHLVRLASKVGCTYSRYADDLTFSTNKKTFPLEIAKPSQTAPHLWVPGSELQRLVTHCRFQINPAKTRMQYRTSRQEVTGLVVNQRINVRPEYRHAVRAMVHSLFTKGTFEVWASSKTPGPVTFVKRQGTTNQLHGMLGFIDHIDQYNKENFPESNAPTRRSSKRSMYREFLMYTDFYAAEAPVILCEGKTDNVYLKYAIRSLYVHFPDLAEIRNGKVGLKVRLYKTYRRRKKRPSSTARILGFNDGGASALGSFIKGYEKQTDRFCAPGQEHPVIILYDNDSGAKDIRDAFRAYKKTVDPKQPFAHAVRNLYAVPTPLIGIAQESKIEDFFDPATKAIRISGKTFNPENNLDKNTQYGKEVFAQQVVRARAATINFDGFRPLLTDLVEVIRWHAANRSAASPPRAAAGSAQNP
jgi:RNA-directed DNA polymerase